MFTTILWSLIVLVYFAQYYLHPSGHPFKPLANIIRLLQYFTSHDFCVNLFLTRRLFTLNLPDWRWLWVYWPYGLNAGSSEGSFALTLSLILNCSKVQCACDTHWCYKSLARQYAISGQLAAHAHAPAFNRHSLSMWSRKVSLKGNKVSTLSHQAFVQLTDLPSTQ